jgi:tRNA (adenine-N(1)-)-methyltransferase non-catalytic subunit
MKQSGKAGEEIVEALTNNSTTFETKTQFAQAKYK